MALAKWYSESCSAYYYCRGGLSLSLFLTLPCPAPRSSLPVVPRRGMKRSPAFVKLDNPSSPSHSPTSSAAARYDLKALRRRRTPTDRHRPRLRPTDCESQTDQHLAVTARRRHCPVPPGQRDNHHPTVSSYTHTLSLSFRLSLALSPAPCDRQPPLSSPRPVRPDPPTLAYPTFHLSPNIDRPSLTAL